MNTTCKMCTNTNCIIKKNVNTDEFYDYANSKRTIKAKKGQNFITEGAPVQGLFFLQQGSVKIIKTGIYGKEQIVRFSTKGDTIGHRGFGADEYYQIGAVSLEESIVCNFTNKTLLEMLTKIPSLTLDLLLFYSQELSNSENKVKTFAQMSVREKVIDSLLHIHDKFSTRNNYIDAKLSRQEIADFSGTNTEQVIRVISTLKKEGSLHTQGKQIQIVEMDKLKAEIEDYYF